MQPAFIAGEAGRLYTVYFAPAPGVSLKGAVLCIPPFCEEMNRTRALAAGQARELARQGYACLLFDLFGTGDSDGELEQASWEGWLSDTQRACDLLEQTTGKIPVLWGIRLGALLAAQLAASAPGKYRHLLFWHPVSDGKTYMTQMLRLRVATLVERNRPAEKTTDMRTALQQGESLEISGYVIPGALACRIDDLRLHDIPLREQHIDWLEPSEHPPGGVLQTVEALLNNGTGVTLQGLGAAAAWNLSERADSSAFVRASLACLDRML